MTHRLLLINDEAPKAISEDFGSCRESSYRLAARRVYEHPASSHL